MSRRLTIGLAAFASVAMLATTVVLSVRGFRNSLVSDQDQPPEMRISVSEFVLTESSYCLQVLAWTAAGTVLAALRLRGALGWMLLTYGVLQSALGLPGALAVTMPSVMSDPTAFAWLAYGLWALDLAVTFSAPALVLARYPENPLRVRRWTIAAAATATGVVVQGCLLLAAAATRNDIRNCLRATIDICAVTPILVAVFAAGVIRWRRALRSWLLGAGLVAYVGLFVVSWISQRAEHLPRTAAPLLFLDPRLLLPIGVTAGVLRHHLPEMRAAMRRSSVYGALNVGVYGGYLAVTVALGSVLSQTPVPGAVTAAVVAVCLLPAWTRLQRAADRLVYGARRDPLRVMAELSDRVAADDHLGLLPAAAATVAAAVRADGVTIVRPDGTILAIAGQNPPRYLALPLRFGGADVGELRVSRPPGEEYSEVDLRFVSALSAQLAVVLSATDLNNALEAERNRVVAATRDERDRLRRDLHDRLGPSLAGMGLGLQALSGLVGGPKEPAVAMVERLRAEAVTAVEDVRRIIDGLRPTVLDTANLTQAVRRHADGMQPALPVAVAAERLPVLAPDVEVAAYCIITEALTNVARHARAANAQVTISADDALHIAVRDDGHGMHAHGNGSGVGLTSMRRRAEALGGNLAVDSTDGGTTITANLPLRSS